MKQPHTNNLGNTLSGVVFGLLVLSLITITGLAVYNAEDSVKVMNLATGPNGAQNKQAHGSVRQPPETLATFSDSSGSGITFRYPSDWEMIVPGSPPVGDIHGATAELNLRWVEFAATASAATEWSTCAVATSSDACGAGPDDATINGQSLTVNSLDVYSADVTNPAGSYYVIVIKRPPTTSTSTTFVELTLATSSSKVLSDFHRIPKTANFD